MSDRLSRLMGSTLSPFWASVSRNWILKIICFILAIAVWAGIRESTSFEVLIHDVPVIVTAGDGLAILEQSTDVVSLRFRGSRDEIRFISRDQVAVQINLADEIDSLRQVVKFNHSHVKAPSMAHVIQFYPPEITMTIDREVERVLPVKASFEGKLPEGMELEKAICDPATVRVRGAERRLLALELLHTAPVSLEGRYNSFNTHVGVADSGQLWTVVPERVAVEIKLLERIATRQIDRVELSALTPAGSKQTVTIYPNQVSIVLKGTPELLENIHEHEVVGYVNCSGLTESAEYELPVRVDLPPGVELSEIDPPAVRVGIKIGK